MKKKGKQKLPKATPKPRAKITKEEKERRQKKKAPIQDNRALELIDQIASVLDTKIVSGVERDEYLVQKEKEREAKRVERKQKKVSAQQTARGLLQAKKQKQVPPTKPTPAASSPSSTTPTKRVQWRSTLNEYQEASV